MRALILGGAFNPVHSGHTRLAIEAHETLSCQRTIWLPGFSPHYRSTDYLLPFDLRLMLLAAARPDSDGVSDLERRHGGPAYTVDTLPQICEEEGVSDPYFVLGLENFRHLHLWRRAEELAQRTSFVIAAREGADIEAFHRLMQAHWLDYRASEPMAGTHAVYEGPTGRRIALLAMPRLDISSTLIRARWREDRDISQLVPDAVRGLLYLHRDAVDKAWQQEMPYGDCHRPFHR